MVADKFLKCVLEFVPVGPVTITSTGNTDQYWLKIIVEEKDIPELYKILRKHNLEINAVSGQMYFIVLDLG